VGCSIGGGVGRLAQGRALDFGQQLHPQTRLECRHPLMHQCQGARIDLQIVGGLNQGQEVTKHLGLLEENLCREVAHERLLQRLQRLQDRAGVCQFELDIKFKDPLVVIFAQLHQRHFPARFFEDHLV